MSGALVKIPLTGEIVFVPESQPLIMADETLNYWADRFVRHGLDLVMHLMTFLSLDDAKKLRLLGNPVSPLVGEA